ncbi:hypothetical protein R1sor_024030 [Riccia sorocarpa]|uniref:Uncharacterized protein n=1 Tax=Riccia sorocarpa TaxID=122646 RepID=A0ABD3GRP0_9MARC
MPRESDRHLIGKQLTNLIKMNILDEDSSSSSDNDLEMLDLLSIDDESGSSNEDSDRDPDLTDDSESEGDDEIGDLTALMDAVEQSRYLTRSQRWEKSSDFLYKYFLDLPDDHFRQLTRMNKRSYMCLLDMISDDPVFHNNSPYLQAEVFVQLAVALDRFGHEGNGACLDRTTAIPHFSRRSRRFFNRSGYTHDAVLAYGTRATGPPFQNYISGK